MSNSVEFVIVVLGSILKNLQELTEEQTGGVGSPDFEETTVIDYSRPPPPDIPPDRPNPLDDLIGDQEVIISQPFRPPSRIRF